VTVSCVDRRLAGAENSPARGKRSHLFSCSQSPPVGGLCR
jgi:hypothetical protein